MKPGECRVNNLGPLSRNVKQHQTSIRQEPINTKGVLGILPPRTMSKFVKVRIRRDEKELLINKVINIMIQISQHLVFLATSGKAAGCWRGVAVRRGCVGG